MQKDESYYFLEWARHINKILDYLYYRMDKLEERQNKILGEVIKNGKSIENKSR